MIKVGAGFFGTLLLIQAISLNVLCFCGSCPISFALGVGAQTADAAHDCCNAKKKAPERTAEVRADRDCCGDAHALHQAAARLDPRSVDVAPLRIPLTLAPPPQFTLDPPALRIALAVPRTRGPPGAPAPELYLRYASLLI